MTAVMVDSFADAAALVRSAGSRDIDQSIDRLASALGVRPTAITEAQRNYVSGLVTTFSAARLITTGEAESYVALIGSETTTAGPLHLLDLLEGIARKRGTDCSAEVDDAALALGFGPDWRTFIPRPHAAYRMLQHILAALALRDARSRSRAAAAVISALIVGGARHLRAAFLRISALLAATDATMRHQAAGADRPRRLAGAGCTVSECPVIPTAPPTRSSLALARGWPSIRALREAP